VLVEETFRESLYIVTLGVVRGMFLEFLGELTENYPMRKETLSFVCKEKVTVTKEYHRHY